MIISWAHPWYLAGIGICLIAIIIQSVWSRKILQQQRSLGADTPNLRTSIHRPRLYIRRTLTWLGLILICVAYAGPRWGSADVSRKDKGAYLVFAIDCSRSMLAQDLYPDRITAAHRKALDIIQENPEHRIALLPFARIATLRTPFTGDHIAIEAMIKDCTPDLFPAPLQGTAIGTAISESCVLLEKHIGSSLAIIVFSDGSDKNTEGIQQAKEDAKKHGVRVYGLFFGDPEREVSIEIDGTRHIMDADRSTLDELALHTSGRSVNATNDNEDILSLSKHIRENVSQEDWQERQHIQSIERYQWFLIPGICLLALALLIPLRSTNRERTHA